MRIRAGHVEGKLKDICAWFEMESRYIEETFAVRVKVREVNGSDDLAGDVVQEVCRPASCNRRCGITVDQCLRVQLHCL